MSPEHLLAFFVFAVVAAVTPGPSNIMLTATGAAAGLLRGLPCLLGVAAGMGLLIFVVALGLGSLVVGHAATLQILNWAGAAFLLWLAWKIATADPSHRSQGGKPVGFIGAALFQWINPKSWIASTGAVGAYLQPNASSALLQSISFAALFVLATLPSGFLWLAFGASMQRFMANAETVRAFNIAMGVLLAASVLLVLW
jgi:threonine/homoserine/homoserine lactone efflux protein